MDGERHEVHDRFMTRGLLIGAVLLFASCLEPALPDADAGVDAGPYVCSPLTCTGCCSGGVCLGGNLDDACGHSGRACRVCSATTACQVMGACISVAQDAGTEVRMLGDAGLTNPFSGNPLDPTRPRCVFVFGRQICN